MSNPVNIVQDFLQNTAPDRIEAAAEFMEDTFASGRSFSSGGTWTIKTDPQGPEFEV